MALILLLCVILPLVTTATVCPNGIAVNKTCYNLFYITDLQGNFRNNIVINQLGVLYKYRILFYSFEPELKDPEHSKIGFVKLDDPTDFGIITPPSELRLNLRYFAIDQDNAIVYFGGTHGIYKFNASNNEFSEFIHTNRTVLSLFLNDTLYFVKDGLHFGERQTIDYQQGDTFRKLLETDGTTPREDYYTKTMVYKFVITKDMVVFVNMLGVYAAKAELNSQLDTLSMFPFITGFSVDLNSDVYLWKHDGLSKVVLSTNPYTSTLLKVAKIADIGALTFDDDNSILFTLGNSLFCLVKPADEQC